MIRSCLATEHLEQNRTCEKSSQHLTSLALETAFSTSGDVTLANQICSSKLEFLSLGDECWLLQIADVSRVLLSNLISFCLLFNGLLFIGEENPCCLGSMLNSLALVAGE